MIHHAFDLLVVCHKQLATDRFLWNGKSIEHQFSSSIWQGINNNFNVVFNNSTWQIVTGQNVHFFTDKWLSAPLVE
jgi:hypothetical protein